MDKIDNYLKNSSIHGLKYLSSDAPSKYHRAIWLALIIAAFASAGYFILGVFLRWRDSPVLMTLSPTPVSTKTIPFPALVFCNANYMRKSKVEYYLQDKLSRENTNFGSMLHDICGYEGEKLEKEIPSKINRTVSWQKISNIVTKVVQNCSELIVACHWRGDNKSCNAMLQPMITDVGFCCAFNRLSEQFIYRNPEEQFRLNEELTDGINWTPERGFKEDDPEDLVPYRPLGSGSANGLKVFLDVEMHEYYCSSELGVGFKINAHNPIESPHINTHASLLSPGFETRLIVTPKAITAHKSIKNVAVNKRNCYFSDERNLAFFKSYTQENCLRECLANYTMAFCGCVQGYMPVKADWPQCNAYDVSCGERAQEQMYDDEFDVENSKKGTHSMIPLKFGYKGQVKHCHCIPSCFDIKYDVAITSSPLIYGELAERNRLIKSLRHRFNTSYIRKNMASIEIFFDNNQFTPYERGVVFGFTDLIANAGGLLGLFLGFSILSVVELVYFILMMICSCKKRNTVKKEETPNVINTQKWREKTFKNGREFEPNFPHVI